MLRWLHLSDVHESAKTPYVRNRMYEQILAHVEGRPRPNVVFLTGDLAFGGTKPEYDQLRANFLTPLRALIGEPCLFFTVPGNHDVDRAASIKPRLWIADEAERHLFQSPDEKGVRKRIEVLGPRFAAYADFDTKVSDWGVDWIRSQNGAASWNGPLNDIDVAVVGVNTAWLSQDDNDAGRLTPGRHLFEKALEKAVASKPQLLFVLGHHPLEALANEHPPHGDGRRVRERLKQANAIYLHGHLHTTDSEAFGANDRTALAIQAPSAFQAHDSDIWRNGLLWGEAYPSTGNLILEPFEWDEHRSEYKFDLGAAYNDERVPGRDAFRIRLPRPGDASAAAPASLFDLPEGWEIVDNALLQELRGSPPSKEEMIGFFDGRLPTWRVVVAPGVRPRRASEDLAVRFRAMHAGASKPGVVLMAAAGGEGKSTALLQAATLLIEESGQTWRCLYRKSAAAELPIDLLKRLPILEGSAWLVLIDDADNAAAQILEAVGSIGPRTDIHLLLAARDADWQIARVTPSSWQPATDFRVQSLSGLSRVDAERIVEGWVAYGPEAMGHLGGTDKDQAVAILVGHARELATRNEDGELLGALLITRQGEDMRAHVRTMLVGLPTTPLIGRFSLRDVYAMVAAMHAENQLYLSGSVLAVALGCTFAELETKVLDLLRREAMLDKGDTLILTRHRRIAEAAIAVLKEDGHDVSQWYPLLASSALKHFNPARRMPSISSWRFGLAKHFASKGERWWPLARRIALAVHKFDPDDTFCLTAYSSVCRETGEPIEAMKILRAASGPSLLQRAVLREWAVVAGNLNKHGMTVWLLGKTISDDRLKGDEKWEHALLTLALAFQNLFTETSDRKFALGQAGCTFMVGAMGVTKMSEKEHLDLHERATREDLASIKSSSSAVSQIRSAIVAASYTLDDDEGVFFERLIGDAETYTFSALALTAQ